MAIGQFGSGRNCLGATEAACVLDAAGFVGDSVSRYHGLAQGNPDLFNASGTTKSNDDPDIYMIVSGNPDLPRPFARCFATSTTLIDCKNAE